VLLLALLAFSFLRSPASLSLPSVRGRGHEGSAGPRWPIRLIQLQLSVLYGVNAVAKTHPDYLTGATLIAMSEVLPNFVPDLSGGVLHVAGLAVPVWLAAVATVATEYVLALGFWFPRLRVATALLGLVFHVALTRVVHIEYLGVVSVFLYAAFLLPFDRPGATR
jgi:hypothetical protein